MYRGMIVCVNFNGLFNLLESSKEKIETNW
jgi:hypothetical protein